MSEKLNQQVAQSLLLTFNTSIYGVFNDSVKIDKILSDLSDNCPSKDSLSPIDEESDIKNRILELKNSGQEELLLSDIEKIYADKNLDLYKESGFSEKDIYDISLLRGKMELIFNEYCDRDNKHGLPFLERNEFEEILTNKFSTGHFVEFIKGIDSENDMFFDVINPSFIKDSDSALVKGFFESNFGSDYFKKFDQWSKDNQDKLSANYTSNNSKESSENPKANESRADREEVYKEADKLMNASNISDSELFDSYQDELRTIRNSRAKAMLLGGSQKGISLPSLSGLKDKLYSAATGKKPAPKKDEFEKRIDSVTDSYNKEFDYRNNFQSEHNKKVYDDARSSLNEVDQCLYNINKGIDVENKKKELSDVLIPNLKVSTEELANTATNISESSSDFMTINQRFADHLKKTEEIQEKMKSSQDEDVKKVGDDFAEFMKAFFGSMGAAIKNTISKIREKVGLAKNVVNNVSPSSP